jgi:hypothetical protein
VATINRDLSRALPYHIEFELSHLTFTFYLIMFNSHLIDQDYQMAFKQHLSSQGFVSFLWSPAVKSTEHGMGYKIWLDLVDLPPHVWSLDELAVISASFGLILEHSPLNNV